MNSMDHEQAIRSQAAERYLLGELDSTEREAYEEHFFSCTACAEEIKSGASLVDATRDFFATAPRPVTASKPKRVALSWRTFLRPVPALAFSLAISLGTLLYQKGVTLPQLRAPHASAPVYLAQSRDAVKTITVPRNAGFGLLIDIPPGGDFSSYEGRIVSDAGISSPAFPISLELARKTVLVQVDASNLAQGRYSVVIYGVTEQVKTNVSKKEIARYPFDLQF